ncbi:MAG: universal stress protein [Leptolyngbyaceae cyanobacterium SU_3_3]|nr:universal stress protein [Leptolyngbyaceae cyanobacterium SU_3_3]NJR51871.1 universal stress protein [Leptolyngbyaceae cyanobacterium CSU_1_3]
MFQRILVALDSSDLSKNVFDQAIVLAKSTQARLMLLHVLSPLEDGYPTPIYPIPDAIYPVQHEELLRQSAQEYAAFEREGLERLRSDQQAASQAGVAAEFTQNTGSPGPTICHLATTWEADLIIVGRRGHAGLAELFLGSVSNHVMHHAPCSVLVVQGVVDESPQAQLEAAAATS